MRGTSEILLSRRIRTVGIRFNCAALSLTFSAGPAARRSAVSVGSRPLATLYVCCWWEASWRKSKGVSMVDIDSTARVPSARKRKAAKRIARSRGNGLMGGIIA